MDQDPVCGMEVIEEISNDKIEFNSITYHFCSTICKLLFEANPKKYIQTRNNINDEDSNEF